MDAVSRRLLKELRDFGREANNHPEILKLAPEADDDLLTWSAQLGGLEGTPYEGKEQRIIPSSPETPTLDFINR